MLNTATRERLANRAANLVGRTHRYGRFVDYDAIPIEMLTDAARHGENVP
jgi:hypothetical protein